MSTEHLLNSVTPVKLRKTTRLDDNSSALRGRTGIREKMDRIESFNQQKEKVLDPDVDPGHHTNLIDCFLGHFPPLSSKTVLKLAGNNLVVQQTNKRCYVWPCDAVVESLCLGEPKAGRASSYMA